MTERKFADEEVIKALECCVKSSHFGECFDNKCPLVSEHGCKVGKETLYPYALDLINRQKAEIEKLEREIEDLESIQEITPEAKYLVDTKADKVISLLNELNKSQEQIKSEAIKEFAERLEEYSIYNFEAKDSFVYWEFVENTAKEMAKEI